MTTELPADSLKDSKSLKSLLEKKGYVVLIGSHNVSYKLAQEIGAFGMYPQPNRSLIYIRKSKMTDAVRKAFDRQVEIEEKLEDQYLGIND